MLVGSVGVLLGQLMAQHGKFHVGNEPTVAAGQGTVDGDAPPLVIVAPNMMLPVAQQPLISLIRMVGLVPGVNRVPFPLLDSPGAKP